MDELHEEQKIITPQIMKSKKVEATGMEHHARILIGLPERVQRLLVESFEKVPIV